jgi:hypothetical protein
VEAIIKALEDYRDSHKSTGPQKSELGIRIPVGRIAAIIHLEFEPHILVSVDNLIGALKEQSKS